MLHRKKHRWLYGLVAFVTAISINLATPTISQAGFFDNLLRGILIWGVQSYQLSNLSDADEENFGTQIHNELVNSGQISLSNDSRLTSYVDQLGQDLTRYSSRPTLNYTFSVINDDSINAFATMGGRVYINTGLMKTASNEAELSSVIGHEIAHITEKHAINQMKTQARNQGILAAAGLDSSQIVQLGVAIALDFPNSRSDERDADTIGFDMLTQAGYAPEAMASFMQKLNSGGGGSPPAILSTHPSTPARVATLQQKADAYPSYPRGSKHDIGLNEAHYRSKISPLL